jgi:outer membrane protein assembly factor BamB
MPSGRPWIPSTPLERLRSGFCAVAALALALALPAADQPQWGGRFSRNMVSAERGLPVSFDPKTDAGRAWTARLGSDTHSTPVVADRRVYLGTNNAVPRDPRHTGDRGILLCLDERTGDLLWQLAVPKITTSRYWDWPKMGICSPVTVVDGLVYAVTNRGEIVCLDPAGMANGNQGPFVDEARHQSPEGEPTIPAGPQDADILWLFDPIARLGVRQHDSAHASILAHGPFLYVNTSNGVDDTHRHIASPDAPSLIVLERATGRLVATDAERIGPRIFHCTWSSPALVELGGRAVIVFCGGDGVVYGFEALTAVPAGTDVVPLRRLWQFDPDPATPKEDVHRFTANRTVSPSNIAGLPVIHDGRLFLTGGGDLWWGRNEAWLKCVALPGGPDGAEPRELWSYPLERHVMSSPVVHDGLVFAADTGRRIHCVDAATGRPYWTHEIAGEAWATPLVADGRVYFATRRGEFLTFAASREKRLLAEVRLDAPISATPVAANGTLYVATMTHLYALREPAR